MAPWHAASARRTEEAGDSLVGRQHFSRRETPDKLTTSSDSWRWPRGAIRAGPSGNGRRSASRSLGFFRTGWRRLSRHGLRRVALLELRDVTKTFGATMALRDISLTLEAGRFHALLGENGAGKSTLIKILAGIHRPTRGEMRLRATELKRQRPRCCARLDSILFTRILPSFQA